VIKKQSRDRIKREDVIYASLEQDHARNAEEKRQLYFENMKRYQERNDRKYQQIAGTLIQDVGSLAKRDEEQYIRAVAEKEDKALRKESEDAQRLNRIKSHNMNGLNFQMQEKEMQRRIKEMQEKQFAEDVRMKVLNEQQLEDAKREEAKSRMRQYNQALNGQMEEARLKKRYGNSLMTEHERRVHEKDIQAFVEGDNQNLYSRAIPGLSSGHETNL